MNRFIYLTTSIIALSSCSTSYKLHSRYINGNDRPPFTSYHQLASHNFSSLGEGDTVLLYQGSHNGFSKSNPTELRFYKTAEEVRQQRQTTVNDKITTTEIRNDKAVNIDEASVSPENHLPILASYTPSKSERKSSSSSLSKSERKEFESSNYSWDDDNTGKQNRKDEINEKNEDRAFSKSLRKDDGDFNDSSSKSSSSSSRSSYSRSTSRNTTSNRTPSKSERKEKDSASRSSRSERQAASEPRQESTEHKAHIGSVHSADKKKTILRQPTIVPTVKTNKRTELPVNTKKTDAETKAAKETPKAQEKAPKVETKAPVKAQETELTTKPEQTVKALKVEVKKVTAVKTPKVEPKATISVKTEEAKAQPTVKVEKAEAPAQKSQPSEGKASSKSSQNTPSGRETNKSTFRPSQGFVHSLIKDAREHSVSEQEHERGYVSLKFHKKLSTFDNNDLNGASKDFMQLRSDENSSSFLYRFAITNFGNRDFKGTLQIYDHLPKGLEFVKLHSAEFRKRNPKRDGFFSGIAISASGAAYLIDDIPDKQLKVALINDSVLNITLNNMSLKKNAPGHLIVTIEVKLAD